MDHSLWLGSARGKLTRELQYYPLLARKRWPPLEQIHLGYFLAGTDLSVITTEEL